MSLNNYAENLVLNWLFGKTSYYVPSMRVALSRQNPGEDASGLLEPPGGVGYARVSTTPASWTASTTGYLENAIELLFPMATGYWGVITYFALIDAGTGYMMLYGSLGTSFSIDYGAQPRFPPGSLKIVLD